MRSSPGRGDHGRADRGLEEGLRATLGARVDASVTAGTDAIRADVDSRFAAVDGQIGTRISEATPDSLRASSARRGRSSTSGCRASATS